MIIEFETRAASAVDYEIDGQLDPTLTLVRGQTYVFQREDSGHPLFIKSEIGSGSSGRYDQGVENNGSSDPTSDVIFNVPLDAPDTLYYQCGVHYSMNGRLNITSAEASITSISESDEAASESVVQIHSDFSSGSNGYSIAMIIGAAFGSSFLDDYFGIGLSLMDDGMTLTEIASVITTSGLVESIAGPSHTDWVSHVYENVMGAPADPETAATFVAQLDSGTATKSELLQAATTLDSLELQIDLVGLQSRGLEYSTSSE